MTKITLVTVLFFKVYFLSHRWIENRQVFFYFMTGTSVKMLTKKPLGCHCQMLYIRIDGENVETVIGEMNQCS